MLATLIFVCLLQAFLCSAISLPPPIKQCKDDNTLKKCILDQSSDVIKALAKGNPKYGIPIMDPMHIPKIEQTEGGTKSISLNLTLKNIDLYGLANSKLNDAELDTSKKYLKLIILIPKIKIIADYILSGKFLMLGVTGKGKVTCILDNVKSEYWYGYNVIKKNGVEYITSVPKVNLVSEPENMSIVFENLYNGDKTLGDATNKMINENWKEFYAELGSGIGMAMGGVYNQVMDQVVGKIPYEELIKQ